MKLVAGSNITAWLIAIGLKKYNIDKKVVLVNFGEKFGGNSQSFKFKNSYIDFGMQTFYQCGIDWADEIVKEALVSARIEFNEFKWPYHDTCLTWQHGNLYNSVYPVHRSSMNIDNYHQEFEKLSAEDSKDDGLIENIIHDFGEDIWRTVFQPIAKKFTTGKVSELSKVSLAALPIDRILAPQVTDQQIRDHDNISLKLAYCDLDNIPKKDYKKRSTIYPKIGGIANLVNALKALAIKYGIQIYNKVSWKDIYVRDKKLQFLNYKPEKVYWTLPNKQLNKLIQNETSVSYVYPLAGCHVAAFCKTGFKANQAHYLLSFDDDPIFRITFYGNLAGKHASAYASIELLLPPEKFSGSYLVKFFKKIGIIEINAECDFSKPMPSSWPISFKKGYTKHRRTEEKLINEKIINLTFLNSNPANSSIMQTPTLSSRLSTFEFK